MVGLTVWSYCYSFFLTSSPVASRCNISPATACDLRWTAQGVAAAVFRSNFGKSHGHASQLRWWLQHRFSVLSATKARIPSQLLPACSPELNTLAPNEARHTLDSLPAPPSPLQAQCSCLHRKLSVDESNVEHGVTCSHIVCCVRSPLRTTVLVESKTLQFLHVWINRFFCLSLSLECLCRQICHVVF